MSHSTTDPDQYFRGIVDSLPLVVCRWLPDTTLTYANRLYRDLIAGGADPVGARWLHAFVPRHRQDEVRVFVEELVASPRTIGYEHEIEQPDGKHRHFTWTDHPIFDQNGRIVEFQSIGLDVTEKRKIEAERERLEVQVMNAERLEAVGRLAGGVAHDVNNMLGVILGCTEFSLNIAPPETRLREDLLEIQEAARRSADLTRQMLAYARQSPAAPSPVDLNERIDSMLRLLRRLIGTQIELHWQPGPALWPVRVAPAQLDQILLNLVVNARDAILELEPPASFGPGRPRIKISTRNTTAGLVNGDGPVRPGPRRKEYVVLSVADTGVGMGAETQKHLFDPFFTTKPVGHGTGLGLATVSSAVEHAGGLIEVRSEPGRGTTFELYFPPEPNAAAQILPRPRTSAPAARARETVLVVEDETSLRSVVERFLSQLDYRVISAGDAHSAREVARSHTGDIDLLLADVVLPGCAGHKLYDELKQERPGLEAVLMSGYPLDMVPPEHGSLPNSIEFLQKPFSLTDLGERVRTALDARKDTRELT